MNFSFSKVSSYSWICLWKHQNQLHARKIEINIKINKDEIYNWINWYIYFISYLLLLIEESKDGILVICYLD